ncbi:unnamed protein product [Mortierella alpina]
MSTDIYARISERMKKENFTEEEIRVVKKAKDQLSNYATGGSVAGGLAGLMLARAKNFKGLQGMAIATGGFLIGSQIGLLFGAMSSVKTIQSIPNFQRILNIVQEVRSETALEGRPPQHHHAATLPSAGHPRFPVQQRGSELMADDVVEQPSHSFQGFQDGDGYHGGNDPNGSSRQDHNSAWAQAEHRAKELRASSPGWSQIRHQNMPKSTWNDIRDGRRRARGTEDSDQDTDDVVENDDSHSGSLSRRTSGQKPALSGWDRVRHGGGDGFVSTGETPDGPSDFARTREDLESRPSIKKNQYGDTF